MLHQFITTNRAELIARTRAKVAQRSAPRPTEREVETGIPLFLDQLASALNARQPSASDMHAIGESAAIHGGYLLAHGFTISQVVHDYGDVCQAVTELAEETDAPITTGEFHTLNRCLDDAIAQAVSEYTRQLTNAINDEGTLRSGVLAHEMRNRLSAANVGFELIRRGKVAPGGSVGALVRRNLGQMGSLIDRSLVEVRLDAGIEHLERVPVADLVAEAEADAALQATSREMALTVTMGEPGVDVNVDRHIVGGVIANLMQNAFKFTRPAGHVVLRTSANGERVLIEVEDECGGLPDGKADELFDAFEQRGENRSGLGLGLFISRKGVEAHDGQLRVTNVPGHGCIFTIDLPRMSS